ncbi:MAG: filamentous hemagglutinin N-terminal domain-containing protein [Scytonema sp. PMC 1069.18]|nr:filamentous hemagglutinin N-terminal domain-containing protein [Scytonema sp. PMC 1069.18]MEC4883309.1 filamentous hemagglutinin N-terminal domain-containing protein [Scytonema sp. PMC 1070.18]
MSTLWGWMKGLGITMSSVIALWCKCTVAQITPDATLPNNSSVTTKESIRVIEGGTRSGNNLFHSFEQFSVPNGVTAYFNNATDIQNIISRVTGKSISDISGTLRANDTANLFLINPNGIIFGSNASLNIGGSFVATTASSLNFSDGTKFSATNPQTTSVLTVSVPNGLQFGTATGTIRNQSQTSLDGVTNFVNSSVGLMVQPGKTLALVGGDVTLEGGNLTAASGRIELGSVGDNSLVSLIPTNQGWLLGYSGVQNFQNIRLVQKTVNGSEVPSIIDTSGQDGSGSIQVQGKLVELVGRLVLAINANLSAEDGKDIAITAQEFIVRDGAQVLTGTFGEGRGGNLIVNASESVNLIGNFVTSERTFPSVLASTTFDEGKAGNITITTPRLRIQDGARVSAASGAIRQDSQLIPATGAAGNLTINASVSVEMIGTSANGSAPSSLSNMTLGPEDAGKLTILTGQLIVRDGATITVSNEIPGNVTYLGDPNNLGKAGELDITARSVVLDNKGTLTSETDTGQGGNITLQVQDLLLLRRNSQISTNAGNAKTSGDGGNITINVPDGFIVAKLQENSDITANAFTGSGGTIQINATGIFGMVQRNREDVEKLLETKDPTQLDPQSLLTSDITAISLTNPALNGVVNLNTPDVDLNRGLINLPEEIIEPKLASTCSANVAQNQSEFIISGRGGIPSNPREVLRSSSVHVPWVMLDTDAENHVTSTEGLRQRSTIHQTHTDFSVKSPQQIVEAQGWVVDNNGDVILVALAPTVTPHSPLFNSTSCESKNRSL